MNYEFPPDDGPLDDTWVAPLEAIGRAVRGNRRYRFFDTRDFMIMCRVVRGPRPSLILYKHYYTRHYLNLDDSGHAYRYIPPAPTSDRSGRYVAHRDLRKALDDLGLWELPWMKPGLERHRAGLTWDDRWELHPDLLQEEEHLASA